MTMMSTMIQSLMAHYRNRIPLHPSVIHLVNFLLVRGMSTLQIPWRYTLGRAINV